jgi:predicted negative regulator of RcsB-dependent stress response|tara:strand:- start:455 stop:694 length:240 start_codon:yes stop_codon:yes gene_type:complete
VAQCTEKDAELCGDPSALNFDWAYFIIILAAVDYFGWRYYQKKYVTRKPNQEISPKVAEEMAKKIKEDAEMHRRTREEN